jgi:hypothetical protein
MENPVGWATEVFTRSKAPQHDKLTRSRRRAKPVGEKNEIMKSRKAESRPGIDDLSELCRKAYMRRLSTDLPSKQATEPQSRKQRPKNKRSGQRKHSVRT